MKILEVRPLSIPELKVVSYARFRDHRGYFTETFRLSELDPAIGLEGANILQVNESYSAAGVVRGLHTQWSPYQGKIVRPLTGRLVDFSADIRKGSPTFGRVAAIEMNADPANDTAECVWVPPGFVHGVYFSEASAIEYLCTSAWSRGNEISISPLDDDLDWSSCDDGLAGEIRDALTRDAILTEKDREGLGLAEWIADPRSDEFVYAPGEPYEVASGR